ncbi:cytochrome b [Ancylobacter terrae]|uniref:cytochrome b n=1 Tax=Ancylobacter sp. sgz301288 TaxID=3342077 RepID=UPI00385B2157
MPRAPDIPAGYRRPARLLHWLIAIIVIGLIPVGITMGNLDGGPLQDRLYDLHRSFGFTVLVLAALRLAYRLSHTPPPLPASVPAPLRVAAGVVHATMYALLLATPIIGWLATNAYGAPISVFGLFELPVLVAKNEATADVLFAIHRALGLAFGALILLHVGAAIGHALVFRDGVLHRMWPP